MVTNHRLQGLLPAVRLADWPQVVETDAERARDDLDNPTLALRDSNCLDRRPGADQHGLLEHSRIGWNS